MSKIKKINKSISKLIRNSNNLAHLVGQEVADEILQEHSVCCGVGRHKAYFVDSNGKPTKVTFPTEFNAVTTNNYNELVDEITSFLGEGYIAFIINAGSVMILSNPSKKEANGTLNISRTLEITNL